MNHKVYPLSLGLHVGSPMTPQLEALELYFGTAQELMMNTSSRYLQWSLPVMSS